MNLRQLYSVEKSAERGNVLWIPDIYGNLPEYLLVASETLRLYEDMDSSLIFRGEFGNNHRNNPIVSCGWCSHDPQYICSVQLNGSCNIWSLERKNEVITFDLQHFYNPNWNNVNTNVGMCFYQGSFKHCFLTYSDNKVNLLNDVRSPSSFRVYDFENRIFRVKCSTNSPWLVACAERKNISLIDVRYPTTVIASMSSFDPLEDASCFSWSLYDEIAIGTEKGKVLLCIQVVLCMYIHYYVSKLSVYG
ncbi:uncharacterized WD repeat-containing protein C17D11.08-like [Centruroides sculpturatus]|uniref:uncharacterized WD repeat-containing protein C17D11.08-like n=1 Tax=Centruroides sculpturatus TaxID=218467 RepID=UPI000C6EDBB9|nr:uncharacterized WD repeat-containing protein C17D11.08-like [Centruroides sculpturatus]